MSVAFDSSANAGGYSAASSLSWNHTNVGTTNLYLQVTDSRTTLFGDTDVTALTYDGVNLLSNVVGAVFATDFQDALPGVARIFELKNPNTGTKAVSMTFTTASYGFGCGSLMYTGVEQSGASSGTAVTNSGNSAVPQVVVNSTTSGNMVSNCEANELFFGNDPIGNQTVRYSGEGSGGQQGAVQDAAAGGDITFTWVIGEPGALSWLMVAAEILASSGSIMTGAGYLAGVGELLGAPVTGGNEIITLGARYRRQSRNREVREDEDDIAEIVTLAMQTISKLH